MVQGLISEIKPGADYLAGFTKPAVDAQTYEGKLYGLPKAVETIVMVYNKDLLPKAPESFDELIKASQTLRGENKYGLLAKFDEIYYSYGVVAAMGVISSVRTPTVRSTSRMWAWPTRARSMQ